MPSSQWIDCPIVIPYYGGKYEMSKLLVPLIPSHQRYIEMFAGGLSMFFRKKKAKWNVVNDIDNNIVNLYMCVMHDYDELIKNLFWLPKSRKLFLDFREEIKKKGEIKIPDPYIAAKYLYCIRNSFNKLIHTPFSKNKDMKRDWEIELKFSRDYLGGTTVENLDFAELVEKYPPKEDDFWYLDPPYVIAGERGDYYVHSLDMNDHDALFEMCKKIDENNGKFMVSYDDHDYVNDTYKDFQILKIPIRYSGQMTGDDYKNELVITNYEPINTQETLWSNQ